jgi:hypothetical protein
VALFPIFFSGRDATGEMASGQVEGGGVKRGVSTKISTLSLERNNGSFKIVCLSQNPERKTPVF